MATASSDPATNQARFGVSRFTGSGMVDTTFGSNGSVLVGTPGGASGTMTARSMAVAPDGDIVLGGVWTPTGSSIGRLVLVRLTQTGALRTTFGAGGFMTTNVVNDFGQDQTTEDYDVQVQTDGKIVVSGRNSSVGMGYLARFNADGSFDTAFSGDGFLINDIGFHPQSRNGLNVGNRIVIQADGTYMMVGSASMSNHDGIALSEFAGG